MLWREKSQKIKPAIQKSRVYVKEWTGLFPSKCIELLENVVQFDTACFGEINKNIYVKSVNLGKLPDACLLSQAGQKEPQVSIGPSDVIMGK